MTSKNVKKGLVLQTSILFIDFFVSQPNLSLASCSPAWLASVSI